MVRDGGCFLHPFKNYFFVHPYPVGFEIASSIAYQSWLTMAAISLVATINFGDAR